MIGGNKRPSSASLQIVLPAPSTEGALVVLRGEPIWLQSLLGSFHIELKSALLKYLSVGLAVPAAAQRSTGHPPAWHPPPEFSTSPPLNTAFFKDVSPRVWFLEGSLSCLPFLGCLL